MKERRYVLLGALAVLAILLWLLWGGGAGATPPVDPPEEQAAGRTESEPPRPAMPVVDREALAVERQVSEPAPTEELPASELEHPFRFGLRVHVRGSFGFPIEGADVFVAPDGCGFTRWPVATSGRGSVLVQWPGKRRSMPVTVAVLAHGVLQPMRRLEVQHDKVGDVAFGVRSKQQSISARAKVAERGDKELKLAGRRVRRERERARKRGGEEQGRMARLDELDFLCGRSMLMFRSFQCLECHEQGTVSSYLGLSGAGAMVVGVHPDAVFQDLGCYEADARKLERERRRRAAALRRQLREQRQLREERGGYVAGVVKDLAGKPVQGASISSVGADGGLEYTTYSDREGNYRFGPLVAGKLRLVAIGGRAGFAATGLTVFGEQTTEWMPELRRFRTVAGTLLDDRRRPLEGWFVELVREDRSWAAVTQTTRDGSFAVHGVPGTVVTAVWPRDAARGLPVLYGTAAMVDAQELELSLHRDVPTRARLRVHVGVPESMPGARVDARVLQLETGVVARLGAVGFEDAFELQPLPPGAYRLQLGAAGAGWVDTGEVVVDGRGLWDVGRFELPRPGRVHVHYVGGAARLSRGSFAFYRRTDDCDVRSRHRDVDGAFELPPGPHVLVWSGPGGRRAVAVDVVSNGATEIVLGP